MHRDKKRDVDCMWIFITRCDATRRARRTRSGSESCIKSEGDRRWFTGADALVVWHSVCGGRCGDGGGGRGTLPAGRPNRAARSLFWLDRGRRDSEYIAFLSLSLSFALPVPISLWRISLRARFISDQRSASKSIFQHGRETRAERSPASSLSFSRDSPTRRQKQTRQAKSILCTGKSLYLYRIPV